MTNQTKFQSLSRTFSIFWRTKNFMKICTDNVHFENVLDFNISHDARVVYKCFS